MSQLFFKAVFLFTAALLGNDEVHGLSVSTGTASYGKSQKVTTSPLNGEEFPVVQKDVCIVGAGPVGLAAAIMLSNPPHNYNCVVVEANTKVNDFNPGRGFMYNVNRRGRKFTQLFPKLDEQLQQYGLESNMSKFCLIPGNPDEPLPQVAIEASKEIIENAKIGATEKDADLNAGIKIIMDSSKEKGGLSNGAFWIQRHEFTKLLRDYCLEVNNKDDCGSVEIISGSKCMDVIPSNEQSGGSGGVDVLVENSSTQDKTKYSCNLVIGADGYRSKVREVLSSKENLFRQSNLWHKIPKGKFHVKKYKSPATHLRIKVLQFPPQFSVFDTGNIPVKTNGEYLYGIRSVNNGPKNKVSLGILPLKDNNIIRPVNIIARPNHDVWKIKDPEELREWFQKSFPRMNFQKENGLLPAEEWERFIVEEGTRFPHCQYTNGVSLSSVDKKSAIVLVGDSLHSYPPDIGQGVNSGLLDVVALGKALQNVNLSIDKKEKEEVNPLGEAVKTFESDRLSETKALIRLARFGSPYQYNQPMRMDRIGKKLWTLNFLLRIMLNKISFGIFPKPAIVLCNDHTLNFRQIMRRADSATACFVAMAAWVLQWVCRSCTLLKHF